MPNKTLFSSRKRPGRLNEAGGEAYAFGAQHALAQYAVTGCFNRAFYTSPTQQLDAVLQVCQEVQPAFVARCAVYARQRGKMKDAPALLAAWLGVHEPALLLQVFDRVIDNGRQLRGLVQFLRSGALGRRAIPRPVRRMIKSWLERRAPERLHRDSVGKQPSLADVIKMVHPRPADADRAALLGYLIGKPVDEARLPALLRDYESYKQHRAGEVPDVPFQLLTALELGTAEWAQIARRAGWQMTRMNLNTFTRHGVWEVPGLTDLVAARLRDADLVRKARAFPYQLLAAYLGASDEVPKKVRDALNDALEIAIENVPAIEGQVVVCPDVSGSMTMPVTGYRAGASSKVTCNHVSGLVAAAFLRRCERTLVLPFDGDVRNVQLSRDASVLENARRVASVGGGATRCSAPVARLNRDKLHADLVVIVSDNESWAETASGRRGRQTALMRAWDSLRARCPKARLVCIDIQPYSSTQAPDREDVLNVGGFGDSVFDVVAAFARGELSPAHWVGEIEKMTL